MADHSYELLEAIDSVSRLDTEELNILLDIIKQELKDNLSNPHGEQMKDENIHIHNPGPYDLGDEEDDDCDASEVDIY